MFGLIFKLVSMLCSLIWFLSNFAIFLIHYFFILLLVSFFISKFFKLKPAPFPKIFESSNSWCISHYGANFDVPENSKASIEYVSERENLVNYKVQICLVLEHFEELPTSFAPSFYDELSEACDS